MSTVTAGNPVVLDAQFGRGGQPSPDAVTFNVEAPDNTIATFVWGVDPAVTNPAGDYYELALGVPGEIGEYVWRAVAEAGSQITETLYGTVFVVPSAVAPGTTTPPGPSLGPCTTWITGEDVAACTRLDYGSNSATFDVVAFEASMALFEISGRQFPGLCERRTRPCRSSCGCWANLPAASGFAPFWWTGSWGGGGNWYWRNEQSGVVLGCNPMSRVRLAGWPIREIVSVTIDGVEMPEYDAATGYRNWRLDEYRWLTRMDLPGPPSTPRFWPSCQNMALDPDQPGTFEVVYGWGTTPPELGRQAATELAQQLWLQCGASGSEVCVLPAGTTRVQRQGIEIERGLLANWLDPTKPTGLVATDLFLQAYCGGMRSARRPAVWSPDVQQFARPIGRGNVS